MKKISILIFLVFFTFSCDLNKNSTNTGNIENNKNNVIEYESDKDQSVLVMPSDKKEIYPKNADELKNIVKNEKKLVYLRLTRIKNKNLILEILDELAKKDLARFRLDLNYFIFSSSEKSEVFEKIAKIQAEEIFLDIWAIGREFVWKYSLTIPKKVSKLFVENKKLEIIWIATRFNPDRDYITDKNWDVIDIKDYSFDIDFELELDNREYGKIYKDKIFCWSWMDYRIPNTEFYNKFNSKSKYFEH